MNSRLPQELQTRKVVSLPDDIRSVVEDLIIQKFDIPEVMGGREAYDPFDPAQDIGGPQNMLMVNLSFGTGRVYRLAQIIQLHLRELNSYDTTYRGIHPIFTEWAKRIANEIDKVSHKNNYGGIIRDIEVEMNGYRDKITNIESLANFIYNHYRETDTLRTYAYDKGYL